MSGGGRPKEREIEETARSFMVDSSNCKFSGQLNGEEAKLGVVNLLRIKLDRIT